MVNIKELAFRAARSLMPKAKVLTGEIAGPEPDGARPVQSGHPAQGLTPVRLAGLLHQAESEDPTRFLELAEEMEEKDLHYAAVLGVRKRAVRSMRLIVEPASEEARDQEAAEFVEEQLAGAATGDALQDMLDALGKGYSATEIVWRLDGARWEIGALHWRDPRWFSLSREDGCSLLIRQTGADEPLPPAKFIIHHPKVKSGLPIRSGLARLSAWGYLFKNFTLRDWAVFCEAYGHPLRLGRYDASATREDKAILLRAVRQIGSDMAAIIPKTMEIDFESVNVTGNAQFYEKKARFWDEQISKGVLGQVATTDAIAGGHAVGRVHEQVRDDIRDADAEQLAASLMRDLAAPLTAFNFGPDAGVPHLRFEAKDEIPLGDFMSGIQAMVGMGMPVAAADVYARMGVAPPQKGEDVIAPRREPVPAIAKLLAARRDDHGRSSLDDLVEAMMVEAGERPVLGLGDIEAALAGAQSLGELRAALARLADVDVDQAQLIDLLARGTAMARAAGELGARVHDDLPPAS